jgi:type II secretory pathway component GspD/PulD (secretin)
MLDEDRRNQNASWKELFAALGVSWPAGSSIKYLETIGKLRVCNTKENLDKLGQVLRELNCTPRQIQMDVQFVAFDLTNIAHIAATGKINTATLTALWTNGCGELLAAPTVVTKSGAEVMVKGVTEVIYPTRFDSSSDAQTSSSNASPANAQSDILPGGWETRETGTIFQVVPEVSAEGQMINLTINPQLVEDPVWHDFGPVALDKNGKEKPTQMQQPFFHVLSTSTSVSVVSGHRVLVSGGMPSRDHKRVVYLFVTATLVDTQGNTLEPPADADVPYNPHASSIAP